ncbi:unnamed protein product, partial [Nesidiocoris tenuis]
MGKCKVTLTHFELSPLILARMSNSIAGMTWRKKKATASRMGFRIRRQNGCLEEKISLGRQVSSGTATMPGTAVFFYNLHSRIYEICNFSRYLKVLHLLRHFQHRVRAFDVEKDCTGQIFGEADRCSHMVDYVHIFEQLLWDYEY